MDLSSELKLHHTVPAADRTGRSKLRYWNSGEAMIFSLLPIKRQVPQ